MPALGFSTIVNQHFIRCSGCTIIASATVSTHTHAGVVLLGYFCADTDPSSIFGTVPRHARRALSGESYAVWLCVLTVVTYRQSV